MTHLITVPTIIQIIVGLLIGVLVGAIHFYSLHWNTNNFLVKGHAIRAFLIQLTRFTALSLSLFCLAQWSAAALLSSLLAILIARHWVMISSAKMIT